MGRKFVAALMAAVALVPGVGAAQERGGGRSWGNGAQQQQQQQQRGDRGDWQRGDRPERVAPTGGGERQWQRGNRPDRGADRQAQGGAERTWQRSTTMQDRGPARQAADGGERTWRRSTDQGIGDQGTRGWAQRRDRSQPDAGRDRRQERRDGAADRWAGRPDPRGNVVTRDTYSGDRQRDGARRDGNWNRDDGQRRWTRSSADWNDNGRWDTRRQSWGSQGRWYDRGGRANWNRDWRRDSRYDWARWRATNRNAFRLPRYYAPYGWNQGYRRFSIGVILSSALFAQNYWINDPYAYRLPDTGDDVRWVRYYNDALLVDLYSGEVVDVIHDMFW